MKMFLIDCGLWNCVEAPEMFAGQRPDFSCVDELARANACLSVSPVFTLFLNREDLAKKRRRN